MILDISLAFGSEFSSLPNIVGHEFISIMIFIYTTLFVCFAYSGEIKKKLFHVGVMYIVSVLSDIIVMFAFFLYGIPITKISNSGIYNSVAIVMAKVVMLVLINIIANRKRIEFNQDMIPLLFLVAVLEVPNVSSFKVAAESKGYLYFITFTASQIFALFLIKRFRRELDAKEQKLVDSIEKTKILETELEHLKCTDIEENKKKIEFFENRKVVSVYTDNILYIERIGRKIKIVEQDGEHEINSSLKKMQEELGKDFLKISQGILINRKKVVSVEDENVKIINGTVLYISRAIQKELKFEFERR